MLFNNRFTIWELKNDEKNICRWICFFAIAHLQKAPISASLKNVPDSYSSAYRRKYYDMFQVLILEKNTHFCEIFGTTERTFKISVVKTTTKLLN